jgi:hypothetical protein
LRRLIAIVGVTVLVVDVFVVFGATYTRTVAPSEAVARFETRPTYAGLSAWADKKLKGARPAPGVYAYDTTGFSKVDRLGVRRGYPKTTVRIVRLGAGCQWQEQVVIFAEHTETYAACATAKDQRDAGFGTRLVYFFVATETGLVCTDGGTRTAFGLKAGASTSFSCEDEKHKTRADVTTTYVGASSVTIGDVKVPCREVRVLAQLTGDNAGVSDRTLCTQPETGLTLRERRTVGLGTRSTFLGAVSYTENATFTLRSLTPLL